jgi:hypothetical protein
VSVLSAPREQPSSGIGPSPTWHQPVALVCCRVKSGPGLHDLESDLVQHAVYRAARHAEFAGDGGRTTPLSLEHTDAFAVKARYATLVDAVALRFGDTFHLALAADVRFEGGEHGQHAEERAPGRGRRIDVLLNDLQVRTGLLDFVRRQACETNYSRVSLQGRS